MRVKVEACRLDGSSGDPPPRRNETKRTLTGGFTLSNLRVFGNE